MKGLGNAVQRGLELNLRYWSVYLRHVTQWSVRTNPFHSLVEQVALYFHLSSATSGLSTRVRAILDQQRRHIRPSVDNCPL